MTHLTRNDTAPASQFGGEEDDHDAHHAKCPTSAMARLMWPVNQEEPRGQPNHGGKRPWQNCASQQKECFPWISSQKKKKKRGNTPPYMTINLRSTTKGGGSRRGGVAHFSLSRDIGQGRLPPTISSCKALVAPVGQHSVGGGVARLQMMAGGRRDTTNSSKPCRVLWRSQNPRGSATNM